MRSEAQKRADKKCAQSDKCKYKTISVRIHVDQAAKIQNAADQSGTTVSKYVLNCALYCLENNITFDTSDDIMKPLDKIPTIWYNIAKHNRRNHL